MGKPMSAELGTVNCDEKVVVDVIDCARDFVGSSGAVERSVRRVVCINARNILDYREA
jgi:hypothetical protein